MDANEELLDKTRHALAKGLVGLRKGLTEQRIYEFLENLAEDQIYELEAILNGGDNGEE